jgi:hypothetical protein
MSNVLNEMMGSTNEYAALQEEAKKLSRKWSKTGLLEGLGDTEKGNMALMLETQAKQLIKETTSNVTGTGGTWSAGTGEQWAGIALPLIRRIFANISSKDFVSVQPMKLPSGLVFFLDFRYATDKAPFNVNDSVYGGSGGTGANFGRTDVTTGGLYGAGRFGYSINPAVSAVNYSTGSATWADLNFNSEVSASVAAGTIKKITVATAQLTSSYDAEAVRSFVFTSGSVDENDIYAAFTKINGSNLEFFVTTSDLVLTASATSGTLYYSLQPADNSRGDFEDRNGISIPEFKIDMKSEAIVAKTRKLKAQWTPEFQQDLNSYQNIDAEGELTSLLSEYIAMEIDLEILDMLIRNVNSDQKEYWSAEINQVYDSALGAFKAGPTAYYTQNTWFQTVGTKMQKLSNRIHQKTLRGGANFIVCSPTIATILESIPGYAADTNGDKSEFAMGVQKVGQLNSRFKVYKNPYFTTNTMLMGYRGTQFLESGAVYAPYIPLIMTPLVYDPDTFTPRKGLMTRYAKKMLRPEFYGTIYVSGLTTL